MEKVNSTTCERRNNEFRFVRVTKDNLTDVITFLGEDFIAITGGMPIQYKGNTYQYDTTERTTCDPDFGSVVVVFNSNGVTMLTTIDNYIVRDDIVGYIVLPSERFKECYTEIPTVYKGDILNMV